MTLYRPNQPQGSYQPETNYQSPQQFYQQPTPMMMPPQFQPPTQPPTKKRKKWPIILLVAAVIVAVIILATSLSNQSRSTTINTSKTTTTATGHTASQQTIHYPPKTLADLRGLAAKGNVSAIHEFHQENVGLTGACPQSKREVTVSPTITGQTLVEDLLAYFYSQHLDSPCGSVVFAYHNQSDSGNGYTAGRISLDVTDSSGTSNLDPNGSNLTYKLTLDIGDIASGQEYTVTYH